MTIANITPKESANRTLFSFCDGNMSVIVAIIKSV